MAKKKQAEQPQRDPPRQTVVKLVIPTFQGPSKRQMLAALVGSIIVFLWSWFSLMVLPWHQNGLHKFDNEMRVAEVIKENTKESGVFVLPYTFDYNDGTSQQEIRQGAELLENGPFMFASIMRNGVGQMSAWPFFIAFFIDFAGALMVTWMLMKTVGLSFGKIVYFVAIFGLSIGVISQLPDWNWWGFPFTYVFVNILDILIGWSLAGIGIAYVFLKCCKK